MPLGKTPILQNDLMAEGDNQKYLLFNDALVALEDADNRAMALDLTSADHAFVDSEILRYALFKCSGHTVARTLTVPQTVGDGTYACNRKFAIRNDGTAQITVTNGAAGNEVTIGAGTTGLLHTNGTDVFSLGGVSNAAAASVENDAGTVVSTLTALKFSGTQFTVTDDGNGVATVTIAVPAGLTDLNDVAAYAGNASKVLTVNATEDGAEWTDPPSGALRALSDVDDTGLTDGQVLRYNATTSKFEVYSIPAQRTAAQVKTVYESNANTNAFTDAEKQKLSALTTTFFKGVYSTQAGLEAAVPNPVAGNFAFIDAGTGVDPVMMIWDGTDSAWVTASAAPMTGTDIVNAINTTLGNSDWQSAPLTDAEVVAAINTQLGNSDWQSGGTTLPAYTANASKHLAVNATEDGLEWVDPPTGGGGTTLPDYATNASKHLAVNATEDGVEWVDPPTGGTAAYPDFTGNTGKVLKVNATEDGVEWATDLQGSGSGTPAEWQGARATFADFTMTQTGVWDVVPLSALATADPLGFFSLSNDRMTVPLGVTHIRVTASVWKTSTASATGSNQWKLWKNGVLAVVDDGTFNVEADKSAGGGYSNSGVTAVSATLAVTPGDYFELRCYASALLSFEGWIEIEPVYGASGGAASTGSTTTQLVVASTYWDGDASSTLYSTSAYASKGEVFTALKDIVFESVTIRLDGGQTVKAVLAELTGPTGTDTVSTILAESAAITVGGSAVVATFSFPTTPTLSADTSYALILVRTDGTATSPVYVPFPGASPTNDLLGFLKPEASIRYASSNPSVGDAVFYSASSHVIMGMRFFDLATAQFIFNLKSQTLSRNSDFLVSDALLAGLVYVETDSSAAPVTITVPAGLTGTEPVTFERNGGNSVTFAAGAGVTINSPGGFLAMRGDYSVVSLKPKGNDVYTLMGDLA